MNGGPIQNKFTDEPWERDDTGALVILCLVAIAYIPALLGGFVWDDDTMLVKNEAIRSPHALRLIWFSTRLPDYFPLTTTSLWAEWRVWGLNPFGYHLTNVLLHAISAVFFWRILKGLSIPGAWLTAAIFAVHPVNVESVAWIAERKNTLSMFFYALAIWLYQRHEAAVENSFAAASGAVPRVTRKWYVFSLGAFLLALLSKTSVVTLPMVLLLCAWWRRSKLTRRDLLGVLPFFALALVLGLVTVWFQYNRAIGDEVIPFPGFNARLAVAGWAVWFYLWKALVPVNLIFVYPKWDVDSHSPISYLPLAALACSFAVAWVRRASWGKPFLFGMGYFVVTLLPTLGFLRIYFQKYSLVADHWQYFSIIGVIALVTGSCAAVLRKIEKRTGGPSSVRPIALGVVCLLSLLTWRQAGIYRSDEILWRDTLAKNPGCYLGWNNLGIIHFKRNEIEKAIGYFETASRIKPDYADSRANLANALAESGRLDKAVEQYRLALQYNPNHAGVHHAFGVTLTMLGRTGEAIEHFRTALQFAPEESMAHDSLGTALAMQGHLEEAIEEFKEALRLDPRNLKARMNYGSALANHSLYAAAVEQYKEVLRVAPNNALALKNLGMALLPLGKTNEAVSHFRKALRLDPNLVQARQQLELLGEDEGR